MRPLPATCKGIFLAVPHSAVFDGQRWVGQVVSETGSPS